MSSLTIASLRQHPELRPIVADRIWRAFWEPYGSPLDVLEAALDDVLAATDFPFTLVALDDNGFVGTVTAIQSDIAARSELGPCVAALWVEPKARGQGIGRALVSSTLSCLAAQGCDRCYLPAKPHLHDYYAKGGWSLVERGVGDDMLDVFVRALP
nr:GNAT family N-acetyltransferase [uncultured Devosia sp.]